MNEDFTKINPVAEAYSAMLAKQVQEGFKKKEPTEDEGGKKPENDGKKPEEDQQPDPSSFDRPEWVPETVPDEKLSEFIDAVAEAITQEKLQFEWGGRVFIIQRKSPEEVEADIEFDPEMDDDQDDDVEEDDKPDENLKECVQHLIESLDPKADAGQWISDFQSSDDPRFAGKSKEKRRRMALAAWYGARRKTGIQESVKKTNTNDLTVLENDAENASKLANGYSKSVGKKNITHSDAHYAHVEAASLHWRAANFAGSSKKRAHHLEMQKKHENAAKMHAGVNESVGPESLEPRPQSEKSIWQWHRDNIKITEYPKEKQDGSDKLQKAPEPTPNPTKIGESTELREETDLDPSFAAHRASALAHESSHFAHQQHRSGSNYHNFAVEAHYTAPEAHGKAAKKTTDGDLVQYHRAQQNHHRDLAAYHISRTAGASSAPASV